MFGDRPCIRMRIYWFKFQIMIKFCTFFCMKMQTFGSDKRGNDNKYWKCSLNTDFLCVLYINIYLDIIIWWCTWERCKVCWPFIPVIVKGNKYFGNNKLLIKCILNIWKGVRRMQCEHFMFFFVYFNL